VYEATVEVDDGREMSWPMDGSVLSSSVDGVLKAGRSSTCRIEGRRKESRACGRGRESEVARAEAVVWTVRETLGALLTVCWREEGGTPPLKRYGFLSVASI
jgi:hypothetical protein